jgi:hypothetical protein
LLQSTCILNGLPDFPTALLSAMIQSTSLDKSKSYLLLVQSICP